jgi:hypothetical protein
MIFADSTRFFSFQTLEVRMGHVIVLTNKLWAEETGVTFSLCVEDLALDPLALSCQGALRGHE